MFHQTKWAKPRGKYEFQETRDPVKERCRENFQNDEKGKSQDDNWASSLESNKPRMKLDNEKLQDEIRENKQNW